MRVLHIVSGDLYAGAERIAEELVIAQRTLGLDAAVVVLNRGAFHDALAAAGVPLYVVEESRHGALTLLRKLRKIAREFRPDVVHTHRFKENILGSLASMGVAPSVRSVHGAPEFSRSGSMRHRVIAALDRFTATSLQKRVVCVSDDLVEKVTPLYGSRELAVVVNGIDPSRVRAAAAATAVPKLEGEIRVGVFARLVPVKRIDVALEAAAGAQRMLGRPVVLHVFGGGPLEKALKEKAAALGSALNARFHGNTLQAPSYMRQMDAVLLTSSHEGLPVSLLEAMSLSVAVVASRVGGIPDVLGMGSCGWLVDPERPADFAAELVHAVARSSERERRVSGALARAEEVFSARRMAQDYVGIYRDVLGETRPRARTEAA